MRKADLPGIVLFLTCCWGCSPEPQGKEAPQSGFLKPGRKGSEIPYEIAVWLSEEIYDEGGDKILSSQSNLLGRIELQWSGYSIVEGHGEMGRYEYNMIIHSLEQSSQIPSLDEKWEETFGGDPPVELVINEQEVKGPMEGEGGDPRHSFIQSGSEAWVSPWGQGLRHRGELPPAKYHNRSAPVGQYFFKGLRVEEWAHACFVEIPPSAWNSEGYAKGESNVFSSVQIPGRQDAYPETWEITPGPSSKKWKRSGEVKLRTATALGLRRAVKDWSRERTVEAIVSASTGLAEEIEIRESGSWAEPVPLGKRAAQKGVLPWIRSTFEYRFKAHRP